MEYKGRTPKDPSASWAQWQPFTNEAFNGWALIRYLDGNGVTGQTWGKNRIATYKTYESAKWKADALNYKGGLK